MPVALENLSKLLISGGVRHHLDADEHAIRVAFVTQRYRNARAEQLAILRIEATDGGCLCRVTLERAFTGGPRVAARCLALCEAVGSVPLARIERDATGDGFRLVAELPVEDGAVTPRQLFALLDAVVAAAEAGQAVMPLQKPGPADAAAARKAA